MKQWLDTADEYIKSWKIRDVALLSSASVLPGFCLEWESQNGTGTKRQSLQVLFSL